MQSIVGPEVRVLRDRGKLRESPLAKGLVATVYPSVLLRMPDRSQSDAEYGLFARDLAAARKYAAQLAA